MRRNLQLSLLLLLASGIYIFLQFSLKGKSKIYYSVPELKQDLSLFFPVSTRTRSPNDIRAGNVTIPRKHRYPRLKEATREPQLIAANLTAQTKPKSYLYVSDSSIQTFSHPPITSKKNPTLEPPNRLQHVSTGFGNSSETAGTKNKSSVRVIIVAHGRSGSSFFGGIFNAHPDFFFIYEPLKKLNHMVNLGSDSYLESAEYAVNAILKCEFKHDQFLQGLSRKGFHRALSRTLVSPPFCNTTQDEATNFVTNQNWSLCSESISAETLNKICRKHVNTALKILLERLEPANLFWLLGISGLNITLPSFMGFQPTVRKPRIPENGRVYVLYLVRDPRAMIYSRYQKGWIAPHSRREYAVESGEADEAVTKLCTTIELSIGTVLLNPQWIKLVRYEELATNPEKIVRHLFRELRISPSKEVFRWIQSKTHEPVNPVSFSLSRNASLAINSWRKKIPKQLLEIVETRCSLVMKYLGYIPTNGFENILRDMRKPLYLHKIRDLKRNYKWLSFLNHSAVSFR